MISTVHIQNYRALVDVHIELDTLTVLVGPNGAGKTSVIRALSFLLGPGWPSQSRLDIPGDFTHQDNSLDLWIQADFDPPLIYEDRMSKTHQVGSIEYRCQPYKKTTGDKVPGDLRDVHQPLGLDGNLLTVCVKGPQRGTQPVFGPLTQVSGGLREQSRVLTITEDRTVYSQRVGRRGSILASLLEEARRSFLRDAKGERTEFSKAYGEAIEALRTDEVKAVESTIQETTRRMLGFMGSEAANALSLEFGFADPTNPFSSLRLMCRQGGLLLPAESLGQGEQSAIVVGMFEAFRQRGTDLNTVLIEEPEMYLHPQAQRYFKRLLADIVDSGGAQIIYTTHSPIFADMTRFRSLRMIRKSESEGTKAVQIKAEDDLLFLDAALVRAKLTQYFDAQTGELLFAKRVLLVEGHGDRLAALEVAMKLDIDLDAEGLSVIDCGGKDAIPFFARACRALEISCVILHDDDLYVGDDLADWQVESNKKAPTQNANIREATADDTEIFTVSPTLEAVLGVGRSATSKPMRVLEAVRGLDLSSTPVSVVQALRLLGGLTGNEEEE